MGETEAFFVTSVIFMVVVAPLWLILHYKSKKQVSQGLSEHEHRQLLEIASQVEKMSDRLQTLEAILDEEAPQWRSKV